MCIRDSSNTDEEQGNKEALADGRQLGIKGSALTKDERKQRTGQKGTQDGFKPDQAGQRRQTEHQYKALSLIHI